MLPHKTWQEEEEEEGALVENRVSDKEHDNNTAHKKKINIWSRLVVKASDNSTAHRPTFVDNGRCL